MTLVKTKPGAIVNPVTCPWYVRRLHREALLKGGLSAYALGKIDAAKRQWKALYTIEPFFAASEAESRGSVAGRLLWHAAQTPGCLFAQPAEMAAFVDEQLRLAVLLADFSYVNEDPKGAEASYRALLADRERPLNVVQSAYVTYALIRSVDLQFKDNEVAPLADAFVAAFGTTPTMPRFLLWRANLRTSNLSRSRPGMPEWESGMADYADIVRRFPKTQEADYACYYTGWSLYAAGDFDGAIKAFEVYGRLYPSGIWSEPAKYNLNACREGIPL